MALSKKRSLANAIGWLALPALGAGVATAPSPASAAMERAPDATTAQIEIRGEVEARCRIGLPAGVVQLGDVVDPRDGTTLGGRVEIPIGVDCNGPFQYEIRSANGGLASSYDGPKAGREFRTLIPYALQVIARDGGVCASEAMKTSPCLINSRRLAREEKVAIGVSWHGGEGRPIAGAYTDQVIIRLVPAMGGR